MSSQKVENHIQNTVQTNGTSQTNGIDTQIDVKQPFKLGTYKKPDLGQCQNLIKASNIYRGYKIIKPYVRRTPTTFAPNVSERFGAKVYFKREDGQFTGSYKIRGLFNRILALSQEQRDQGVICATSGNQGASLGYVCSKLNVKAVIIMPTTISNDKVNHIKTYANVKNTTVIQHGIKLSETKDYAEEYAKKNNLTFISFEDDHVIEGCGTVAVEILDDIPEKQVDFVLFSMSSGSLAAGLGSYFKQLSPETTQVGVIPERQGYEGMTQQNIRQSQMQSNLFDESALLQNDRNKHENILSQTLDGIYNVNDGMACSFVTYMFNQEKIVMEPYSAVCPAALDYIREQIKGKVVVCILCGSFRYDVGQLGQIRTLGSVYEGKLHYLTINFFAKHGAIKQFLTECLGENDQISMIEYTRKNNREKGPALVGIESPSFAEFENVLKNLKNRKIEYKILNPQDELFKLKI